MRTPSVLIASSLMLFLTACGGKTLSFKNSDEVIKSYKAVTADLTEAERLEFRRNMFLVAWTAEKADADISLSDVQTAWSYERDTVDLTGPDAAPLAKELALKGVSKLDGKTVAQVNALGESLSGFAVEAEVKTIETQLGALDTAIEKLNADKQAWKDRKTEAAAAEAALVEATKKYNPKVTSKTIGKNWQGPTLTGKILLTSPHADPINDFRNTFTVEHNGYIARYRDVLGQSNQNRKESPYNLNLDPQVFINEKGESLAKDYNLPTDVSGYEFKFRPTWVRTSGTKEGWKTHEYKLSPELSKALYDLKGAIRPCDQGIETANKLRTAYAAQIETLKRKKFDDLKRIYGRYAEGCI